MDWFAFWEWSRRSLESFALGYSGYLFAHSLLSFLRCRRQADYRVATMTLTYGLASLGAAFCLVVLSQIVRYLGDMWTYG